MEFRPQARILIEPGTPFVLRCPSPTSSYVVVFEDDGIEGRFLGLDHANPEKRLFDPLLIYKAANAADYGMVSNGEDPPTLEIFWREDGPQSCLAVNGVINAIFEFDTGKSSFTKPRPRHSFFRK